MTADPVLTHWIIGPKYCPRCTSTTMANRLCRIGTCGSVNAGKANCRGLWHPELDRASCSANQRILPTRTRKQRPGERIHSRSTSLSRHDHRNSGEQRLPRLAKVNGWKGTVITNFKSFISIVMISIYFLLIQFLSLNTSVNKPFILFWETTKSQCRMDVF